MFATPIRPSFGEARPEGGAARGSLHRLVRLWVLFDGAHGVDLTTLTFEAGLDTSFSGGRIGRRTSSPPQFGQTKPSLLDAHSKQ